MEFNKEIFEKALKDNKIVRYQKHFEDVVKSYLEIENQALRQPLVSGEVCDNCGEGKPLICAKCYETESNFRESY
jgi:CTP-dependent riboflavin kinase